MRKTIRLCLCDEMRDQDHLNLKFLPYRPIFFAHTDFLITHTMISSLFLVWIAELAHCWQPTIVGPLASWWLRPPAPGPGSTSLTWARWLLWRRRKTSRTLSRRSRLLRSPQPCGDSRPAKLQRQALESENQPNQHRDVQGTRHWIGLPCEIFGYVFVQIKADKSIFFKELHSIEFGLFVYFQEIGISTTKYCIEAFL